MGKEVDQELKNVSISLEPFLDGCQMQDFLKEKINESKPSTFDAHPKDNDDDPPLKRKLDDADEANDDTKKMPAIGTAAKDANDENEDEDKSL